MIAAFFLLVFTIGGLGFGGWLLYRNNKVYQLRIFVNHISYNYSIAPENLNEGFGSGWRRFYHKLPAYNTMIMNRKKIKLTTYFTQEEIELIKKYSENENEKWFRK